MTLVEMMETFQKKEEQNEKIREIVYTKLPVPFQVALVQHGVDPTSFASGINFILQVIQVHGLPTDWAELVKVTPPDPAKESKVKLTRVDGQLLGEEVAAFMKAWFVYKGGPENPPCPRNEPSGLC